MVETPGTGPDAGHAAADALAGRRRLRELIFGFARTQLVYVAAELGIPDLIAAGTDRLEDLAAQTGADPDALGRVLRGLAAAGVVAEGVDGRLALTPVGEALREGVPGSLRSIALAAGSEWYGVWAALLPNVRSGDVAFDQVHGTPLFAWYADHPEAAAAFDQRMVDATTGTAAAVVAAIDFAPFRTLVDLGGGRGHFLAAVLRAHPHLRGVLFDLPPLAARARENLTAAGLGDRADVVAGDFFADPLPAADAFLLSQILHDWDDDRCVAILRAIRSAIPPSGRLLVVETLLPERIAGPSVAVDHDLLMLTITGGRERTEGEYRALFAAGGFALERVVPTAAFREAVVLVGVPLGDAV